MELGRSRIRKTCRAAGRRRENEKAIEATRKAYELRDRVSEREKLYILEHYYQVVTGEKAGHRRFR
jgi:hypothetical protein